MQTSLCSDQTHAACSIEVHSLPSRHLPELNDLWQDQLVPVSIQIWQINSKNTQKVNFKNTQWINYFSPLLTNGFILLASPPRRFMASRMAARSTTAGTPVKSCTMQIHLCTVFTFKTFVLVFAPKFPSIHQNPSFDTIGIQVLRIFVASERKTHVQWPESTNSTTNRVADFLPAE